MISSADPIYRLGALVLVELTERDRAKLVEYLKIAARELHELASQHHCETDQYKYWKKHATQADLLEIKVGTL